MSQVDVGSGSGKGGKERWGEKNEAFIRPVPHEYKRDTFASWAIRDDVFPSWFPKDLAVKMCDCCEVNFICLWICLIANLPLFFLS